jgi:adenylate cyclase class 2
MNQNNLELKHFCSDFAAIRKVLLEIGASKDVIKTQKDYFFELPKPKTGNPRLKLRIENEIEKLIYYDRPEFKKGKDTASKIKLYEVKDKNLLPFLIESPGVKSIVEKKREIWRKDNTVFHLDNVKNIGKIFEIELQKNGKINKKDIRVFKNYQDMLLPYLGKTIKSSNADLVLNNKNKK